MKQTRSKSLKALEQGQIWQMDETNLRIELVGKRLVHYKLYSGKTKRIPVSLSDKEALVKYLSKNKAILIQE